MVSAQARAGLILEFGGTYLSDTLNTSSSATSSKYFYNAGILFSLQKNIWGGWNYSGISHTDTNGTTTTFSSSDTGPYVKWQFGKHDLFSLSAMYNILSRATFSDGTVSENWEGTSMLFQFGVSPEIKNGLHIGVTLNYYLATYGKKTVDSVESSASNSKSWIFPTLVVFKEW